MAVVEQKLYKFEFEWSLEAAQFSIYKNEEYISSQAFAVVGPNHLGIKWRLDVYPKGDDATANNLSVYLHYIGGHGRQVNAASEFVALNTTGPPTVHWTSDSEKCFNHGFPGWGYSTFLTGTQLKEVTPTLRLKVVVHIPETMFTDHMELIAQGHVSGTQLNLLNLLNFEDNAERPPFSDFVIRSEDGAQFFCHKIILTGRSSYFRTRLQSNVVTEAEREECTLPYSKEVVKNVLSSIYNDAATVASPSCVASLLDAAEMLELPKLKLECEKTMVHHLEKINCVRFLILADRYKLPVLKNMATNWVIDYFKEIQGFASWKVVDPGLIQEVLTYAVERTRAVKIR